MANPPHAPPAIRLDRETNPVEPCAIVCWGWEGAEEVAGFLAVGMASGGQEGPVMAVRESGGATGGAWRQVYSERRFGLLLALLIALLAGTPILLDLAYPPCGSMS